MVLLHPPFQAWFSWAPLGDLCSCSSLCTLSRRYPPRSSPASRIRPLLVGRNVYPRSEWIGTLRTNRGKSNTQAPRYLQLSFGYTKPCPITPFNLSPSDSIVAYQADCAVPVRIIKQQLGESLHHVCKHHQHCHFNDKAWQWFKRTSWTEFNSHLYYEELYGS